MHKADDPKTFVDLFDAGALAGGHGGDVFSFTMHADAALGGDEDLSVMQRTCKLGQAGVGLGEAE